MADWGRGGEEGEGNRSWSWVWKVRWKGGGKEEVQREIRVEKHLSSRGKKRWT